MRKAGKCILAGILILSFVLASGCKKKKEPLQRVVLATDPYFSCEEFALSLPAPDGKELKSRHAQAIKVFSEFAVIAVDEEYVIPKDLQDRWDNFHYDPQNVEEYKKLLTEMDSYRRTGLCVFGLDGTMKNFIDIAAGSWVLCLTEDPSGKAKVVMTPYDPELYVYRATVIYDLSPEGELTNPVKLDRTLNFSTDILFLENGNMLCRGTSSVLLYAPDGVLLGEEEFGFDNVVNRLFRIGEKYYAYFLQEDIYDMYAAPATSMYEIDPATGKKTGENLEVTSPVHASFLIQGKDGIYALLGNGLRKYDLLEGNESQTVFSWNDTDCNYSGVESESVNINSDNDIYTIRYSHSESGKNWSLMHLHRQETNPHVGENIIYLGTIGNPDPTILEHIKQYNLDAKNKTRIVVLDYSGDALYSMEYSDEASSWWALKTYSTDQTSMIADEVYLEILGGDGPDILLNFGSFSQYNTERALVDLNTLIDGSAPLDRSLLFDNILTACEKDGKLYQLPLTFLITGMVANQKYVGDRTGWTYEEFREIDRSLPDGVRIIGNISQSELLETLMDGATGHLVDYNKETVDFDNPEFREILDFVKTYGLPNTRRELAVKMLSGDTMINNEVMFDEGSLVARNDMIFSLEYFARFEQNCCDPVRFIGYPSLDGAGARADTAFSMAITQASQNKEEAWNFIRSFFEEDVQLALAAGSFPMNRNAFDALLERDYENDRKAWEEVESDPEEKQTRLLSYVPIREDHITALREVVENIREARAYDPTVMMIINEEAPGYYTDVRTLDDVVRIIEKRSKAVVQERG